MNLAEQQFYKLKEIVSTADNPGILPIGKTRWYAGMKTGEYPKPIKFSERVQVWRAEDIKKLVDKFKQPSAT